MKIQYTQFCLNPALRGTTAHLPQHRAVALIDSGAAIEVPLPQRGSPEWLQAMKERSAAANPQVDATVSWTVSKQSISERFCISAKCSAPNCTTFAFDNDPDVLCFPGTDKHMSLEHLSFVHSCGCGYPEKIPVAICEQYRKLDATYKPTRVSADVSSYYSQCTPGKDFGQKVDLSKIVGPTTGPLVAGSESQDLVLFQQEQSRPVDLSKVLFPVKP